MTGFLHAIENTGLSIWVRESGTIWSYPLIITFHAWGLSILVGLATMIDLRLLGVAPRIPIAPLEKLYPVMWLGFWLNLISGALLLIGDAATMLVAPLFYAKIAIIVVALCNLRLIHRALRDPAVVSGHVTARVKFLAATSLALWVAAIGSGRLTAYIGPAVALNGITR